jgi:uncharacterized protein (TIGR02145 family)
MDKAPSSDNFVLINGVRWATRNVDEPGTFAPTPESAGKFYQWNRKKAWPATGSVNGWDSTDPEGNTWATENDPSPAGWRVPTSDEIHKLIYDKSNVKSQWATLSGVYGRRFIDINNGNSIFLPAAGNRGLDDGPLLNVDYYGGYWSSTGLDSYLAYFLSFGSDRADQIVIFRSLGFSVRPVADE